MHMHKYTVRDISAPPFRRWDFSALGHFGTGVSAPDVSARQWKLTVSDPTTVVSGQKRALGGGRWIRGGYERWGVGVGVMGMPSGVPVRRAGVAGELE